MPSGSLEKGAQPTRSTSKQKSLKHSETQDKKPHDLFIKSVHPTSKSSQKSIEKVWQNSIQNDYKAESNRRQNQVILQQILKKNMNQDSQTAMALTNNTRLFSTHSAKNSQSIHHPRTKEQVSASFDLNHVHVNNPAHKFLEPYSNCVVLK